MTRTVLGIDPGGRESGLVVRQRDDLAAHRVVVRPDRARLPDGRYVRQVLAACTELLAIAGVGPRDPDLIVTVEGVAYWPERQVAGKAPRDQRGLYGTAIVLGAILARWPTAELVEPGAGHGGLGAMVYPNDIKPPAGGAGNDRLRHCRSAWDVSYRGENAYLIRAREAPTPT